VALDKFFGNKLTQMLTLATLVAALLGVANQINAGEPYWIASRDFVRSSIAQATTQLESRQIQTQIYLANSERSRIENEIANKQVLLDQNKEMPQAVRELIQEQIRALMRALEASKATLEDLKREAAAARRR